MMIRAWVLASLWSGLEFTSAQEKDEQAIRELERRYAAAWMKMDEEGVMALFESEAMIVPASIGPQKGQEAIRAFWFPKDSSVTVIQRFDNQVLSVEVDGDLAQGTQKTFLSWSYTKGSLRMRRDQIGYALTIYRRQPNGQWKIWRRLWTDVWVEDK